MSDKKKFQRAEALKVADEIVARLKPCCLRLVIAGSLRRGKSEVGDIEILYVPMLGRRVATLFEKEDFSITDALINKLLGDGYFTKRPSKTGVFTWGQSNKLAIHTASGIPVDLFATTEENWWVSLVIRTGSKETNLRLTTSAQKIGRKLNAYGCGVTESDGNVIPATSERHVFELCGVPYLEPEQR